MERTRYHQFTQQLIANTQPHESALALAALGSMAVESRLDEWSDHNFWLIIQPHQQARFLNDLSWLTPYRAD